jgi:ornithine cyclodeaminase
MSAQLGVAVQVAASAEEVVRASNVVVTTTPSKAPLIQADWLHSGLHITAMGADLSGKQELDATCFARADRIVCDRRSQCSVAGDLQHALKSGAVRDIASVAELGEVVMGKARGRTRAEEITICDLTGTGVQDTAIGVLALQRARARGLGTTVKN